MDRRKASKSLITLLSENDLQLSIKMCMKYAIWTLFYICLFFKTDSLVVMMVITFLILLNLFAKNLDISIVFWN